MPEQCNAQIVVGGETLTCRRDDPRLIHYSEDGSVEWTDDAPGAVPHREPRYGAVDRHDGSWCVAPGRGLAVARFTTLHPDAEGAARAEAARLNGDVPEYSHEDWQRAVLAQQEACRERDTAQAEAGLLRIQANAYRAVLEQIASAKCPRRGVCKCGSRAECMEAQAREALYGKDDR